MTVNPAERVAHAWLKRAETSATRFFLAIRSNTYGMQIGHTFMQFSNTLKMGFERPDCKVLKTKQSGDILFGAPAEIIKTLMKAGIGVPQTFVLPADFVKNGELMAEVEFVLYHNVFFQGRKLRVIGTKEQLAAVKAIMQESFFGPRPEEVAKTGDLEGAGYYSRELAHFRGGLAFALKKIDPSRDPAKGLPTLDEFFDFIECNVGESVKLDAGKARGPQDEMFDTIFTQTERGKWIVGEPAAEASSMIDTTLFIPKVEPAYQYAEKMLETPDFGVTFLGTSSGFDPAKRTTSFILWAEGKGILVDPLADPKGVLHKYGIHEDQLPFIFLTHAHADHDAGVLRLVLNGKRIKLITSKVIYESLLRKARAMGVDAARYIDFIEVVPGQALRGETIGIPGLTLDIRAALHSIPTIRFKATYNNNDQEAKSIFYSADTYYDPPSLQKLYDSGVLLKARLDDLLSFGWDAQEIIHEAGMAPIHSPKAALQAQAAALQKTIHLVHTGEPKPGEEIANLPVAAEGSSLSLVSRPHDSIMQIYGALRNNALLRRLPLELVGEMVDRGRIRNYRKGETVIQEGSQGDSFFIVVKGVVNIVAGGEIVANLKDGHYFGEAALLTGEPRNASVQAATQTSVLEIPGSLFDKMIEEFPAIGAAMGKALKIRPAISRIELLKRVPPDVLSEVLQSFTQVSFHAGQNIVVEGEPGDRFFVIKAGKADVIVKKNGSSMRVAELGDGDVFGEIALLENTPRTATITASTEVTAFVLTREDFERIARSSPSFSFYLTQLAEERKRLTGQFVAPGTPNQG